MMANAIWQQAAYTTYQLSSRSTRTMQNSDEKKRKEKFKHFLERKKKVKTMDY